MKAAPNFGAALVILFPKPELGDEVGVAAFILFAQIVEQTATLVDHHQQAAAAVIVLCVRLEMRGQRVDAVGQDRDLHFRRSGVALVAGMVLDDFGFALGGNRHNRSEEHTSELQSLMRISYAVFCLKKKKK